ncbi:MAG: hypothetical protein UV73_C0003G0022 [Candidatus Gottesmanbacteria bacterium GW2011_GWA2_43_14]|uniref:BrnT family toxin n=1 Tax=Candidatus Gottesmanbacteria bacterium GW2011_GWA2_43_14 TaxID=1618443 RepID=A0A0G1DJQ4_9BACT|nr:MAG: hypothetical protein UV73_C0003G0022 [Candidatus Gottesmanbacteria bacterium GW2011_GWA2_43_14]
MSKSPDFNRLQRFDWDVSNINKNKEKHKVEHQECEEIFTNKPLVFIEDKQHSQTENRWGALGKTNKGRLLVIYFTIRTDKIRVISARDQGKKDRLAYKLAENLSKKQSKERGDKSK